MRYVATGESIPPDIRDISFIIILPPAKQRSVLTAGNCMFKGKLIGIEWIAFGSNIAMPGPGICCSSGNPNEFTIVNYSSMSFLYILIISAYSDVTPLSRELLTTRDFATGTIVRAHYVLIVSNA